ncbi:hypothetical protein Nepgr_015141 [Nepenthes gracilis]|uniref:Uncharacterized protein n=1 Tax=Nepenthes gracilis TaxID=150966 RepID=A0AAD3SMA1_NEPGR|nr:hypothetical protein Nepgr_015141 [Nepenthes gracilis]
MATKDLENRVFVGGLSLDVTERQLEGAFRRFGKILDCQIMMERDTGRPRGFGFLTFADRHGVEDAIREMHGREFGDRIISVNKAQPKPGEDPRDDYAGGYSSGAYRGGDRSVRLDECFKCGRMGHWARDCPSAGGGRSPFSSRSRYAEARGRDRYNDDRYDGGHDGAERFDSRDKYETRDHFVNDRYPPSGDRYAGDRHRGSDRYVQNRYDKFRGGHDRIGSGRYGSGRPIRNVGVGHADRPGPYDRPRRGGRPSSYDPY